jgi:hypothetical protein
VDDTFIIWPHGQDKLTEILDYLNGIHTNIKFTMEIGGGRHLLFLDIDIYKKANGSLGHKVYRKTTHTNLYLHHHPATRSLRDQESLAQELQFLTTVFKNNGYSPQHITHFTRELSHPSVYQLMCQVTF